MNILRSIATHDAPIDQYGRVAHYRPAFSNVRAHGYHRDEAPYSQPIGKVCVLGKVWKGDLEPLLDATVAALEPFEKGFVYGGAVGPAAKSLDLGRCWVGNFQKQLTASRDAAGDVDVSELLLALSHLQNALGGGAKNGAEMQDAFRNLRRARDGILSSLVGGVGSAISAIGHFGAGIGEAIHGASGVLKPAGGGGGSGHESGGEEDDLPNALASLNTNTTSHIRDMQRSNDSYWIKRNGPGHTATSDASYSTALRDAKHQLDVAKTPYEQLRAMNAINRASR